MEGFLAGVGAAALIFLVSFGVFHVIDHIERSVVDRIEARLMDDEDGDDADAE